MREVARPKATPSIMETLKDKRKIPIAWKMDERNTSVPLNWFKVLDKWSYQKTTKQIKNLNSITHSYITILTASLSKLSPNMTV